MTTVTATDPDLDAPTFALAGEADQALFTIDSVTGALAFIAAPDFETPADAGGDNIYDVIVRASDGHGGEDDQAIAVTVTNADDSPAPNDAFTMAENGKNAGTVSYDDANGQAVSYSIASGVDSAKFAIDATTGKLTFLKGPNFEEPTDGDANGIYDVNVTGTQGSSVETHMMHVTVGNVDGNAITGTKGKDLVNSNKTVNGQPHATGEEDLIVGRKGNDKLSGLGGNDTVRGGAGKDKLVGNGGDDMLKGGRDKDVLTGGKGADTFYFGGDLKPADIIKDFGAGDLVMLKQSSFRGLDAGMLSQETFDEYFTYKNGKLAYDHDGSGGDKAVVFAIFANKADIGASELMVA